MAGFLNVYIATAKTEFLFVASGVYYYNKEWKLD